MAIKELLVHLNQTEGADIRLRLAMDLAARHASHMTALFVDEWNESQIAARSTAEMGLADARAMQTLDQATAKEISQVVARLRSEFEISRVARGLQAEWCQVRGFSAAVVARFAPYADLCVLGQDGLSSVASADSGLCESLLISLGTPILFVPKFTAVTTLASRIVVAWDSSRTATRALNDAIPLIAMSDRTLVLNIDSGRSALSVSSLDRLAARLRQHCTSVEFAQLEAHSDSIADAVQAKAHEVGADLIVSGAYGHSRLKEHVFGGVTRDLLTRARLPLLMSH